MLLATRPVDGRSTGRKVVLRTICRSLVKSGHEIKVFYFQSELGRTSARTFEGVECIPLSMPSIPLVAMNIVLHCVFGRKSINECVYFSSATAQRIRDECEHYRPDVIIADMVRTAQYVDRLHLPWILDLDDLLSERYSAFAEKYQDIEWLGYYGKIVPRALHRVIGWVGKSVLRFEALRLACREREFSRRANVVSLVSRREAELFSKLIGRAVENMPMSIQVIQRVSSDSCERDIVGVFLGSVNYKPNLDAIRYYRDLIRPQLLKRGLDRFVLRVAGFVEPNIEEKFTDCGIQFVGYVEDISMAFCGCKLFVGPIVSGTGVKTKILEAMAAEIPVVTTPAGILGLEVVDGEHVFIGRTAEEFAKKIQYVIDNPTVALSVAIQSRRYVVENFAESVLEEKWRRLLDATQFQG